MARPRKYESNAERQAAYYERNGLVSKNIRMPAELAKEFDEWLKFKDRGQSETVCKLIRQQLLRKR